MTLDYGLIVNAILGDEDNQDIYEKPEGLQEYFLSRHSKNIVIIEAFEYSVEWLEKHTKLKEFLDVKFTDWWEGQGDEDVFREWFCGGDIRIPVRDPYVGDLIRDLLVTYRQRITETWTCEECGKEISEKHPFGHAESISRVGVPDPDVYPGGVPEGTPTEEINYVKHIYCDRCWRKKFLR